MDPYEDPKPGTSRQVLEEEYKDFVDALGSVDDTTEGTYTLETLSKFLAFNVNLATDGSTDLVTL